MSDSLATPQDAPQVVKNDVKEKIQNGRVLKLDTLFTRFIYSPFGLISQFNGGWKRIHHLSYSRGPSVNCYIHKELGSPEYTTFDEAIKAVLKAEKRYILMKNNLANSFRHISVATCDWWLFDISWENIFSNKRFLLFGLCTSPFLFDLFVKVII